MTKFIKGEFECLVEIRPILVGTVNHSLLSDPGAGGGRDRVEVADYLMGSETEPGQVVGTAVGSQEARCLDGQSRCSAAPTEWAAGPPQGSRACHVAMVQEEGFWSR